MIYHEGAFSDTPHSRQHGRHLHARHYLYFRLIQLLFGEKYQHFAITKYNGHLTLLSPSRKDIIYL